MSDTIKLSVDGEIVQVKIEEVLLNGSSIWGAISGTLADQADLNSALGLKADAANLSSHIGDATIHYPQAAISITEEQVTNLDKYSQVAIDAFLSSKSDTTHDHDLAYSALGHNHDLTYSALGHGHDDIYYTETEIDTLLSNKSDTTHSHDLTYAALSHIHTGVYEPADAAIQAHITAPHAPADAVSLATVKADTDIASTILNNHSHANRTALDNVSGINTGDQDLSGYALKTNVLELDNTDAFTPDSDYEPATKKYVDDNVGGGAVDSVNGETGVVVLDADNISDTLTTNKFTNATDISRLANTSGTNTGDQDLSGHSLTTHDHDALYSSITHLHTGVYEPADAAIQSHITAVTGNPHNVLASDIGLGNVENTALSTWSGSANIVTIGTLTSGSIPYSLVTGGPSAGVDHDAGTAQGQMAFWDATLGKWTYSANATLDSSGNGYFAGNVGINTNTPTNARLVSLSTTGNQLSLEYSSSVRTDFQTDSSGNLYISNAGNNVAIGNSAGNGQTRTTAVGAYALQNNSGSYSNGFGYYALYNNTGIFSSGFGYQALYNNTGARSNGFGHSALHNNTGIFSSGFGYQALYNNTGIYSSGFGYQALYNNTGDYSSGFGHSALHNNTGDNSTGLGAYTLYYNQNDDNLAIGKDAWADFLDDTSGNQTFDNTDINASTDRITITAHGFGATGAYINLRYTEGTSAITGLTNNTVYQVKIIDANTIGFYEADGPGGASRGTNITDAGTGTGHTLTPQFDYSNSIVIGNNINPTASNQINIGGALLVDTSAGNTDVSGTIQTDGYKSSDGSAGITTSFTNGDGATVTIKNGIITDIT